METVVGSVLAFVGFFVLIQPFAVGPTASDPFTQLLAFGFGTFLAVVATAIFIRRSHSIRRLYMFVVGIVIVSTAVATLSALVSLVIGVSGAVPSSYNPDNIVFQALLLLVTYAITFHLVYRGGYAKLKSGFA
jgi:hypothetical protein